MTGDSEQAAGDPSRRVTVKTTHADAVAAGQVAASVRPDNTASMDTQVEGDQVVTSIERETTGGLASTVDDYVVNVTVAAQCTTDPDAASSAGGGSTYDTRHTQ